MATMETEAQDTQTSFRLVIVGDGSIRTIPLLGSRWTIGRAVDCEIQLRDPTVSRRHVLLQRRGQSFVFRDLGGRNPVLVDGEPRSGGEVAAGQTIAVGLTRLHLERRELPRQVAANGDTVLVTGREVIDDGLLEPDGDSNANRARRILERIEWTFADLGSLSDAAEPLLALALNLTERRRGLLGQFLPTGSLEPLATLDTVDRARGVEVPEIVLREAQQLKQVSLVTSSDGRSRLLVPLGDGPDGVLVLDEPGPGAAAGQELLLLANTLGKVIWHRLFEVRERLRLRDEVQRLRFQGTTAHNAVLTSTRLQSARQLLRELANAGDPVLLVGERGTEREDLARYLHSEAADGGTFASIHVGMLPAWRIERALFGDGQPTSSPRTATAGTLFIDGVDLLPPALQQRLASHPPESRLVGAADAPPSTSEGWLPELRDLFLSHVIPIPPLRDEAGDVVALAELFLSDMGSAPDGSPRLLSERAKRALTAYSWPGNVRQLRQVLEAAAAQAGSGQITPKHLPAEVVEPRNEPPGAGLESLADVERRHIRSTLQRLGGNRTRTAQALGIAPSTLYDKLRRYGIDA